MISGNAQYQFERHTKIGAFIYSEEKLDKIGAEEYCRSIGKVLPVLASQIDMDTFVFSKKWVLRLSSTEVGSDPIKNILRYVIIIDDNSL